MRIKMDGHNLLINVTDLVEYLDDESKLNVIDSLSCTEAVIESVAGQILGEWTDMGSRGLMSIFEQAEPDTAINKARRKIAKASGEVACETITRLEKSLLEKDKRLRELENERADRMYR